MAASIRHKKRASIEELNEFGRARLEEDFLRRDSVFTARGRTSDHLDFATGWIMLAIRHRLWAYFTPEAREYYGGQSAKPSHE